MAINRPTTKTIISTNGWGIPITDEVNALRTELNAVKAIPAWINATYSNGWTTQTGMPALAYRKELPDLVRMRGVIHNGSLGQSCTTLPAGYRPPGEVYYTGGCWNGSAWIIARTVFAASGTVTPTNGLGGANVYWQIDITFSITA
jgi:hypothetical protein